MKIWKLVGLVLVAAAFAMNCGGGDNSTFVSSSHKHKDAGSDTATADVAASDAGTDVAVDTAPDVSLNCGDGQVGAGEACDDGNTESGDGCSSACQLETCSQGGVPSAVWPDADGDGYGAADQPPAYKCDGATDGFADSHDDCDDTDPATHPDATEVAGDGIDQNCDGHELCYVDSDQDGYRTQSTIVSASGVGCTGPGEALASLDDGDCDDSDKDIHPGATETPADGVDQDCDGQELCYVDADGDGYLPDGTPTQLSSDLTCSSSGLAASGHRETDCDDTNCAVHPGATEIPGDGVDENCDGQELCYIDADNDGYRNGNNTVESSNIACDGQGQATASTPSNDCNDGNSAINPSFRDIPDDGIDNNCDGKFACYADADNDGYRPNATATVDSANSNCTDPGEATASDPTGDCMDSNPRVHPGQTSFFGTDRGDGSYDYNCDRTSEKRWTKALICNSSLYPTCSRGTGAWNGNAVPACGAISTWTVSCGLFPGGCIATGVTTKRQECR